MNAGRAVADATTAVLRAAGSLVGMEVKKRLSRTALLAAADELEKASDTFRRIAGEGVNDESAYDKGLPRRSREARHR